MRGRLLIPDMRLQNYLTLAYYKLPAWFLGKFPKGNDQHFIDIILIINFINFLVKIENKIGPFTETNH